MTFVQNHKTNAGCPPEIDACLSQRLEKYLQGIVSSFSTEPEPCVINGHDVCNTIFRVLTSHRHNYLSRGRSEAYRHRVLSWIEQAVRANEPVAFYYDLGGGYRASLRPGVEKLTFTVGLGELLALRQIARFRNQVRAIYSPGVRFSIVIDNLCAYFTNDIALDQTHGYVEQLRRLIDELGLDHYVGVLVESELFSVEQFRHESQQLRPLSNATELSAGEHENVARFLGRLCASQEAEDRVNRYACACAATERLLKPVIRGIRLTQRATPETLCFRSFPGGDQRIQSGDVAFAYIADESVKPVLITSRNVDHYQRIRLDAPAYFPPTISEVVVARPLSSPATAAGG